MLRRNKTVLLVLTALIVVSVAFTGMANAATQREYVVSLIKSAGMKDVMISTGTGAQYDRDADALAKSLGFFNNWNYEPTVVVTAQMEASMETAMAGAFTGLRDALNRKPMTPYFVNGQAQPIFYYGDSKYNDTTGEGVVRFVVYVESDLDTDNDGKLDLVKTLVQLPRAALEGAKLSTIFEARPYIEGTNGQSVIAAVQTAGDTYRNANPNLKHEDMYKTAPPRVRAGEATTADMAANANFLDWYYRYSGGNSTATITAGTGTNEATYEDLNWYDYFLVRGFAVVMSAGIGSAGSEGFATCGADVEVNAFRCIIEWLAGDRVAYTDKTNNIEIKADLSSGNVGMTGRSYAGTTQFGLSTSGVKGLKTVVPVAGIASWYEYTNSQGVTDSNSYIVGLAWHVNSRIAEPVWRNSANFNRYAGISQMMRREESALVGDYGPHWAYRDYTVDNWFRDWGPTKIQIPILLVHGANDNNVRPKQSVMMYEAAKKAGAEVRWIWHQGEHMTPTFPAASPNATDTYRPFSMMCGDYTYDQWLNMWFSNHLYNLDNGVMKLLTGVLAHDNASGEWVTYESWDSPKTIIMNNANIVPAGSPMAKAMSVVEYEEPVETHVDTPLLDHTPVDAYKNNAPVENGEIVPLEADGFTAMSAETTTLINSVNGSGSWQNFLNGPTLGSQVYHYVLPEDVTVKGVVKVKIRAAINSGPINGEPLRMHARLAEVAAPGTSLRYYGGNAMGSTPPRVMAQSGGSWQGGGIASHNLVSFSQVTTGTYREIARGYMDLCNPSAAFDSFTANRNNRIIISGDIFGVYHDYEVYLQPVVHTAKAGNTLALIITTGGQSTAAYSGANAFTFTIDNDATYAEIPVAVPIITINTHVEPATTVIEGRITGNLTVLASATGAAPLNYQWYRNTTDSNTGGTAVVGATNSSFPIPTSLTAGTYYYYCMVSAAGAQSVSTNPATVTVLPQPTITISTQPQNANVTEGRITGALSVNANVTAGYTLSYQWYSNTTSNIGGTLISGATSASFTIPASLTPGAYYYYCEVSATNIDILNTNVVTVTVAQYVQPVISITTQPEANTTFVEGSVSGALSVVASATQGATVNYQWYSNTTNSNVGGTAISGANGASFTIPASQAGTYYYFCEVTATEADDVRSDVATVEVTADTKQPVISITTQPANASFTVGNITGSLSVVASVTEGATANYQWFANTSNSNTGGTAINGATSASFAIPTTLTAGAYYYFCEVRATGAASLRSNVAIITVNPVVAEEVIITAPKSVVLAIGDTHQFAATVLPDSTADKSVTWTSNNSTSAIVSNSGLVAALSAGTARITATTVNGKTDTATVTVTVPSKTILDAEALLPGLPTGRPGTVNFGTNGELVWTNLEGEDVVILRVSDLPEGWDILDFVAKQGAGWNGRLVNGEILVTFTNSEGTSDGIEVLLLSPDGEESILNVSFSGNEKSSSGGGCNAGFVALAIMAAVLLAVKKRK